MHIPLHVCTLLTRSCALRVLLQVPDFESVGSLWVDAAETRPPHLQPTDYRSPDPAELYPALASGALQPASIETESWCALETALAQLTRTREDDPNPGTRRRFQDAWKAVRKEYAAYLVAEA